ncbi:hypothetical protein J6TS2_03360 [Heyndrickxia sporothermodurans]|nr:hypothetical protein J6TS2_03360 [Heyndrickxia sporothermodurans]
MIAQDPQCEVNNCTYWGTGNKCNAKAIYVVSHKGKKASNNKETDCKTFVPEI